MKSIFVFMFFIMSSLATQQNTIRLCGRHLAAARFALCENIVTSKDFIKAKRLSPDALLSWFDKNTLEENDKWVDYWPWNGRRGGLSADWTRYKRVGIADECCIKSCTADVILSYC